MDAPQVVEKREFVSSNFPSSNPTLSYNRNSHITTTHSTTRVVPSTYSNISMSSTNSNTQTLKSNLRLSDEYKSYDSMNLKQEGISDKSSFGNGCETPHHSTLSYSERCPMENITMEAQSEAGKRKKGTRRGTLNAEAKNVLKAWMFSPEHFAHPYPSEEEKSELAAEAGIEVKQLSNWFTNARKRLWQPVLRQSGVEVKNFLSTGRGGPRGAKLEVPVNIDQLVNKAVASAAKVDDDDSMFSSPRNGKPVSKKRVLEMKPEFSVTKHTNDCKENPSKRLCEDHKLVTPSNGNHTLNTRRWVKPLMHSEAHSVPSGFLEQEIRAAESLLGLYIHCQSVH